MALRIPFLRTLFSDAVFVHVVRHPASNFRSLVRGKRQSTERFWGTKVPGWRDLLNAPAELQAVHQRELVTAIIERDLSASGAAGGVRHTRVRYEDFQKRPEEAIQQVASVIGIDVTDRMSRALALIEQRSTEPKDEWKHVPSEYREWLARLASELGYET